MSENTDDQQVTSEFKKLIDELDDAYPGEQPTQAETTTMSKEPTETSAVVTQIGPGHTRTTYTNTFQKKYEGPTKETLLKVLEKRTPPRPDWVTDTCMSDDDLAELMEMHKFKRPHSSNTERDFIREFIKPLGVEHDDFGNRWIDVGDDPKIIWSSHIDTVHTTPGMQSVQINNGTLSLIDPKDKCLGADDGAGVWLMLHMIRNKVPGRYIFHRAEETGGQGSDFISTKRRDLLKGIQAAIAFDRMGYDSVITEQFTECASDDFAYSFARCVELPLAPDPTGVFTDTANYVYDIPECSNISVGYHNQHGPTETLDVYYLTMLRDALIKADFAGLDIVRDPREAYYPVYSNRSYKRFSDYSYSTKGDNSYAYGYEDDDANMLDKHGNPITVHDMFAYDYETLVRDYAEHAVKLLMNHGITETDFLEYIYERTGRIPV